MKSEKEQTIIKPLDVYKLEEVSNFMEVNTQTLRKYIRQGKLRASKVGSRIYIKRDDIMQMLDENVIKNK